MHYFRNIFPILRKIFNRMPSIFYMMRHNYKSHGKHCYLRSFKTNCKKCGQEVLYWECTHGSKLFFNYPPYGKLIRHFCRENLSSIKKKSYPILVKSPNKNLTKYSPSCPVCGKLFKNEEDISEHLRQLKNNDEIHKVFFDTGYKNQNNSEIKKPPSKRIPKFGRITIKEKNNDLS